MQSVQGTVVARAGFFMDTPFSRVNHTTEVATRPEYLCIDQRGTDARRSARVRAARLMFPSSSPISLISSLPLPPFHFSALCRYKASPSAAWVNNGVNRRQRGPRGEWAAKGARWARGRARVGKRGLAGRGRARRWMVWYARAGDAHAHSDCSCMLTLLTD